MSDEIKAVLQEVSNTMLDDGVVLALQSVDGGVVRVRVVVDRTVCDECLVPVETIEAIVLNRLRSATPDAHSVEVSEAAPGEAHR